MKSKINNSEQTTELQNSVIQDQIDRTTSYVVIRDGNRVSDREYYTQDDNAAIDELNLWRRISKNHSYGEPVNIVKYDPKKHRVW